MTLNFLTGRIILNRIILFTTSLLCFSASAQSLSKTLEYAGETRSYKIYIPASYDSLQPVPLVMALHGLGDNAGNFQGIGFNQVADTANILVVYPNALPDPLLGSSGWNTGMHPLNNIDDVGFLNALLDTILEQYSIDTNRIYSTGFSLGGFMSYRIACELGDRLAAVASVSGSLPAPSAANCAHAGVMPTLHIHGTSDQTIPYTFGILYVVVTNLGADSTSHYWVNHNSCSSPAIHDSLPDTKNDGYTVEKYSYNSCSDSSEVVLFKVNGMAHTWPTSSNDISATKEIWNFFSRHHKVPADTTNTGLTEITPGFIITPNPASENVFIKSGFSEKIKVVLTDLTGKEIYRDESSNSSFNLNLIFLKEGIYLLMLTNEKTVVSKKLVVVR